MKNVDWQAAWQAELDQSCESTLTDRRPSLGRGVPRSAIEGAPIRVNESFGLSLSVKKRKAGKAHLKVLGCSWW